jgi:hypothetical protein
MIISRSICNFTHYSAKGETVQSRFPIPVVRLSYHGQNHYNSASCELVCYALYFALTGDALLLSFPFVCRAHFLPPLLTLHPSLRFFILLFTALHLGVVDASDTAACPPADAAADAAAAADVKPTFVCVRMRMQPPYLLPEQSPCHLAEFGVDGGGAPAVTADSIVINDDDYYGDECVTPTAIHTSENLASEQWRVKIKEQPQPAASSSSSSTSSASASTKTSVFVRCLHMLDVRKARDHTHYNQVGSTTSQSFLSIMHYTCR